MIPLVIFLFLFDLKGAIELIQKRTLPPSEIG